MKTLDRGDFLRASGALVVSFATMGQSPLPKATPVAEANGRVAPPTYPHIDSWLAVTPDGNVQLYYGKVELGTGIETAISQLVADEMRLPVDRISVVPADTTRSTNQGYTSGSQSLATGATPVRQAAAAAYQTLLSMAATKLGIDPSACVARDGVITAASAPGKSATYRELIGGRAIPGDIPANAAPDKTFAYVATGKPVPRVDIPAKVAGTFAYIQNMRVPDMLHGRIVRPPSIGAVATHIDKSGLSKIPETIDVVSDGGFVGVVAKTEWHAIQAARALKVSWSGGTALPATPDALYAAIRTAPNTSRVLRDKGTPDAALKRGKALSATYEWPYQNHGAIGPSCAIADVRANDATVYSGTQGVFPLRGALAQLLHWNEDQVRVVYFEGSGCYGHNGADDVAADAVLLSRAVKRPVRVQWMRADEHQWEPKGPGMVMDVSASLDAAKKIDGWRFEVWTPSHATRPDSKAGNLLAGRLTGAPKASTVFIGGDRNARTNYNLPNERVTINDQTTAIVQQSALRGLGGMQNAFANESFIDELAHAAGMDPIAFRLQHLSDPDHIAVMNAIAPFYAPGRGFAFVQYQNVEAIVAAVAEVSVDRKTGVVRVQHIHIAHECGLIVNPDGLRNQIEGNVIQATSRTLKEAVAMNRTHITDTDWESYPILRFSEVPNVSITLLERRSKIWGAGEATGTAVAPAIANAIFAQTGVRLRRIPFTPAAVKAALKA
jgi:nicotinate dehydrogenase subunit B